MKAKVLLMAALAVFSFSLAGFARDGADSFEDQRREAQGLFEEGNFREALDTYSALALDPKNDSSLTSADLDWAVQCLRALGRISELDGLLEKAAAAHSEKWRVLHRAAEAYFNAEHYGYLISGDFHRGHNRGEGAFANSQDRDRARALQLMAQALKCLPPGSDGTEAAGFYFRFAAMVLGYSGRGEAWRLQHLTDLTVLPDCEEGYFQDPQTLGAPVNEDGAPVFYTTPLTLESARNDGERWLWLLDQAARVHPDSANHALWEKAQFFHGQFGVQTMAAYPGLFARQEQGEEYVSGPFAVHTLKEDETLARLATGVRRFTLPDHADFIAMFQAIASTGRDYARDSLQTMAAIFENRRQYERAAQCRKEIIRRFPNSEKQQRRQLEQIEGALCRFGDASPAPVGGKASVDFIFRNGKKVSLEAREILVEKLLDDMRAYLKSNPRDLDWNKIDISNIGYRLVTENQTKYLGGRAARWDVALNPRKGHFDRRITLETPLDKPGAYLLTASMEQGNKASIVLWIADAALVKKPLDKAELFLATDAVTGKPLDGLTLHFFGYAADYEKNRLLTKEFARVSGDGGQVTLGREEDNHRFQWLVSAGDGRNRLAFLGFTHIWGGNYSREEYGRVKALAITDRPVYRPGQTVHFKMWVQRAEYGRDNTNEFSGRTFGVQMHDPQGGKALEQNLTADAFGGMDGQYVLPEDAKLGVYQLRIPGYGGGSFRVEEYKKPEFEVTVKAPDEPVVLGESLEARVSAQYYFGAPVAGAKAAYKVLRTERDSSWFPPSPWDWLYGPGYWWFGYDYAWYPGFKSWGCFRPRWPWWWQGSSMAPEIVAQGEAVTDERGEVRLTLDTALAKELRGDSDHQYQITVEVTDQSRRTIVGRGSVLAARNPFTVTAWGDRGHYQTGESVNASFEARTPDGKPVAGQGKAVLFRVSYKDGQVSENQVKTWSLATDAQGRASLRMEASQAGQYRLALTVTDSRGRSREGAFVFCVLGQGDTGRDFNFDSIELTPDRKEYAPGDTVNLRVSTRAPDSTVFLFMRPVNGVYKKPVILPIQGKSVLFPIKVGADDMPNFFVEALTVHDGKVWSETRQIAVPPEKKVLNLEVLPSSEAYKPGQKAHVDLRVTDVQGRPHAGSLVLTVYDRAVEYISGGSNVPDIRDYFWKWVRRHYARTESSLDKYSPNLDHKGYASLQPLGVFGHLDAPEDKAGYGGRAAKAEARGGGLSKMTALASPAPMLEAAVNGDVAAQSAGEAGAPDEVAPHVRAEFADTAFWAANLETDANGFARVSFDMPENLTSWQIRAWAVGQGAMVGQGSAQAATSKDLLVRLQAPRFFVETDEAALSANIHNYLKNNKQVRAVLELDGGCLELVQDNASQVVSVEANGEMRVDWRVRAVREGEAVVRMKALTDQESDAMEMRFPVYVHGMEKTESYCGVIRPQENDSVFTIDAPPQRRPEASRLEIRYSPTLAGAMADALPYLANYPYGCTEQTLNRFLPAIITLNVLKNTGVDLEKLKERRANLNAGEMGDALDRAAQWRQWKDNPVFDPQEVERMAQQGVDKLTAMQLSDGGWGWFSGRGERSSAHTTATVVRGLLKARQNGVGVVPGMLERGVQWLQAHDREETAKLKNAEAKTPDAPWKQYADNQDALVFLVLAQAGRSNPDMEAFLMRDKAHLSVYGLTLLGAALHKLERTEDLARVMRNIDQYMVCDDQNQTCYLDMGASNYWWLWWGSEFEAHAWCLKLLAAKDPKGTKAPGLVKYLLNNRKHGARWNSTRDTALCIEALADYLKASGEDQPDMLVSIHVDGALKKQVPINRDNLFSFDNLFVLEGADITSGSHEIRMERKGRGPLYYNAWMSNFTLEDFITRAGLEITVDRKVYKLVPVDKTVKDAGARGQVLDRKVEKHQRVELKNLDVLQSGDLVEVMLTIHSKNDYEYVVFEDFKPAGFEPVDVQSGYTANGMGAYMELRDERTAFFVRSLARGEHSLSHRLRAEIPGAYSALPAKAHAMYAPELKANSDEIKLRVTD